MMQIPSLDSRSRENREAILDLYLSIIADVVPFYPEDVLQKPDSETNTENYYMESGSGRHFDSKEEKNKKNKALRARAIIKKYSATLHEKLYHGYSNGHVNPGYLRTLLTARLDGGKLDKDFFFSDQKGEGDQSSINLLKHVFCYERFSKHKDLYRLISMLGVDVCPYCNRQFTTTFAPPKNSSGKGRSISKTRPQLDHFKAKSEFPYLALSITNLIPCCGICNHMKGNRTDKILYPYSEGLGDTYKFKTSIPGQEQLITQVLTGAHIAPELFDITLDCVGKEVDKDFRRRADASKKVFALEGLYQSHKGYVSDMYFHRYITTEEMIDSIMDQFKGLFKSRDEVRQALMLADTSADALGKRPLAKLTKDIKEEIEAYYSRILPSDQ